MIRGAFYQDVINCARCNGSHKELLFRPLANAARYTHWAVCPETEQPVMGIDGVEDGKEGEALSKEEKAVNK